MLIPWIHASGICLDFILKCRLTVVLRSQMALLLILGKRPLRVEAYQAVKRIEPDQ